MYTYTYIGQNAKRLLLLLLLHDNIILLLLLLCWNQFGAISGKSAIGWLDPNEIIRYNSAAAAAAEALDGCTYIPMSSNMQTSG